MNQFSAAGGLIRL